MSNGKRTAKEILREMQRAKTEGLRIMLSTITFAGIIAGLKRFAYFFIDNKWISVALAILIIVFAAFLCGYCNRGGDGKKQAETQAEVIELQRESSKARTNYETAIEDFKKGSATVQEVEQAKEKVKVADKEFIKTVEKDSTTYSDEYKRAKQFFCENPLNKNDSRCK